MAHVQPDNTSAFRALHTFLHENSIDVFDITGDVSHQSQEQICPREAITAYLKENHYERADALLRAQFGHDPPVSAQEIVEDCPVVSCVLASIGRFDYVGIFVQDSNLSDQRMPLLPDSNGHAPSVFPVVTSDPGFWERFDTAQWKYFPRSLKPRSAVIVNPRLILPFVEVGERKDGNTARVRRVKLHPEYDEMKDRKHCDSVYAVKTYRRRHARRHHDHESLAFAKMARKDEKPIRGIIKYFGSFEHRGSLNIVLEYAERGNLEDLLNIETAPSTGDDLVAFWNSMFEVVRGLWWIHQPRGGSGSSKPESQRGWASLPYRDMRVELMYNRWHQDLKPTNILRVASRHPDEISYQGFVFKIADFGLSDFKTVMNAEENATTQHRWGTSTYGAPECYARTPYTESQRIQIDQKVDVWALGGIFSEVSSWIVDGRKGVTVYREARVAAHDEDFRAPDCFHDGTNPLPMIQRQHSSLKENLRRSDYITGPVLDVMVAEMLSGSPGQRPTAEMLLGKVERVTEQVKIELPRMKSTSVNRSRLVRSEPPPDHSHREYDDNFTAALEYPETSPSPRSELYEMPQTPQRASTNKDIFPHDIGFSPVRPNVSASSSNTQPGNNESLSPTMRRREDSFEPNNNQHVNRPVPNDFGDLPSHTRGSSQTVSSKPSELNFLSVADAKEFRDKRAHGNKAAPMPFEQQLKALNDRDHVFMIDDSRTMRQHWQEVEVLVEILAYFVKRYDPDGCEMLFLSSTESHKFKHATKAREIVHKRKPNPDAITNLQRLNKDVQNYVNSGNQAKFSVRSLLKSSSDIPRARTVYILTDGILENGDDKQGQAAIRMLVDKMTAKGVLRGHVGIQFISFGKNPKGLQRLHELDVLGQDPDVFTDEPNRKDFVDTEPSDGNVLTMLLGSLNPKYDNYGEEAREPRSRVTSSGSHATEFCDFPRYAD